MTTAEKNRRNKLGDSLVPTLHSPRFLWLRSAVLFVITILVYLPSFRAGFIWDDDVMLTENPLVKAGREGLYSIWFSSKLTDYFPLTSTSFWLEWRLWGMNPAGYHATNVILHALGAVLLWRVLSRLFPSADSQRSALNPQLFNASWCAALLFAVHPVCVASVTWITERKNTLSMAFYLLSILCYLRFDQQQPVANPHPSLRVTHFRKWYWLSLGAFALALLAKTSVVILPLVLLLCVWWRRGRVTRPDLLRSIPFFVLALILGLVTVWFQVYRPGQGSVLNAESLGIRLLGGIWAVWFYLWKSILPLNLNMIYPRWEINPSSVVSYLPGLAWFGLLFLLWHLGRTGNSVLLPRPTRNEWGEDRGEGYSFDRPTICRALFFALSYSWLALLPVLGFFSTSFFAFSRATDHWQYLSIIGMCGLLGASIAWLAAEMRRKKTPLSHFLAFSPAACVLALLCLATWRHQKIFSDAETLWRDTLAKNPKAWVAHNGLGVVLFGQRKMDESIGHYREALRLNGRDALTHGNLAVALTLQGKLDEAVSHYEQALALNPKLVRTRLSYAMVLTGQRKFDQATVHCHVALKLEPQNANVRGTLGVILFEQGKLDEAAMRFSEVLRIAPNHEGARHQLGNVLVRQNKLKEAAEQFKIALRTNTGFAQCHEDLGNTFVALGNLEEAEKEYVAAICCDPKASNPHYNLALLLARQNRIKESVLHYRDAIRLKPDFADALNNLAWMLATSAQPELRNGAEAVELAEKACQLSGRKEPTFLGTLDAALAEAGRFPEAIATVQEAHALFVAGGQTELAQAAEQRLFLYREGKAFHTE